MKTTLSILTLALALSATSAFAADSVTAQVGSFTIVPVSVSASSSNTTATATISPGQTCDTYINSYLKIGAQNNATDVKNVQIFLNTYMNAGLPTTGYFGALTKAAVITYQNKKGLYPSGIVLTQTRWFINNDQCPSLGFPRPKA